MISKPRACADSILESVVGVEVVCCAPRARRGGDVR